MSYTYQWRHGRHALCRCLSGIRIGADFDVLRDAFVYTSSEKFPQRRKLGDRTVKATLSFFQQAGKCPRGIHTCYQCRENDVMVMMERDDGRGADTVQTGSLLW